MTVTCVWVLFTFRILRTCQVTLRVRWYAMQVGRVLSHRVTLKRCRRWQYDLVCCVSETVSVWPRLHLQQYSLMTSRDKHLQWEWLSMCETADSPLHGICRNPRVNGLRQGSLHLACQWTYSHRVNRKFYIFYLEITLADVVECMF